MFGAILTAWVVAVTWAAGGVWCNHHGIHDYKSCTNWQKDHAIVKPGKHNYNQ